MDAAALPCARCGYDLRAQPPEGVCPECDGTVAEARRLAALPVRPAWANSDPRWRRRVLAGAWVLTLTPLFDVLGRVSRTWAIWVPAVGEYQMATRPLSQTLLVMFYPCLVFCVGVVLLFSKERHRRAGRLDWTRRWGVIGTYFALFLGIASSTLILGLVATRIAASFMTLPHDHQPAVTDSVISFGSGLIYYGPEFGVKTYVASAIMLPAVLILLACLPLYNALRSNGSKWLPLLLLTPLALSSVAYLVRGVTYLVYSGASNNTLPPEFYFRPSLVFDMLDDYSFGTRWSWSPWGFAVELVKWLAVASIAVWLTLAQLRAWRRRSRRDAVG